ncbi:MAG: crotonase/enoyl-CoA hydratase family protein [Actinomycetota bacterium]
MSVHHEIEDRVAVVTIDRPEVRNAVDGPTAVALYDAMAEAEADEGVDVVVLTGAGGTFCAGADLKAIAGDRGNRVTEPGADEIVGSLGPMGPTRRIMAKPVIAAVEGHAVAGGLELALWCDLRVAARDATFGVYCRRWGVPLIDGGTIRLPRLIGHSHAMDLILTGRPVDGEEALRIGLANRLVEPGTARAEAVALGRQLSAFPQRCLRSDRRSVVEQWGRSIGGALANEARLGMATIRSGETRDGAARFSGGAGRHGSFEDLGEVGR